MSPETVEHFKPSSSTVASTAGGALAVIVLAACAGGFNQELARGYTGVTAARDTAGVLLDADAITADEAEQVQQQADNARAGLDIARSIRDSDPERAQGKLHAVLVGLRELRQYLAKYFDEEGAYDGDNESP